MTNWVLVTLGTILAVETFLRTPFKRILDDLVRAAHNAHKTIKSKFISDHWKEVTLPRYAFIIFRSSITLFGCLLLTILPVILIDFTGAQFGRQTLSTMASVWGVIYSTAIATAYAFMRTHNRGKSDYTALQKLLHFLALSNASVGEALFDAEIKSCEINAGPTNNGPHVFVSGLARAGTTTLMRSIHETGQFASLTYADMPFVLAPNLWSRISGKSKTSTALSERAHGDRILVNQQSPEALEEVFWQVFTKKDYVNRDGLRPHQVLEEVIQNYRKYVSAILRRYGKSRYLSKNNNNILRMGSIHEAFPSATILIPFRNPLDHANSLLKQHMMFQQKQRQDPFIKQYMAWLGHYEFGLTHKPFRIEGAVFKHSATDSIDYWLELWNMVYLYLFNLPLANTDTVVFISYEQLCTESDKVWDKICEILSIQCQETPAFTASTAKPPQPSDLQLLERSNEIYALLDQRCRDRLLL